MSTDTDSRTITVASHFGDKELTKAEFIKHWTNHTAELKRIDYSMDWQEYVFGIIEAVSLKAGAEFETMYTQATREI